MTSANNAVKRRALMLATAERRIRDITRLEQAVPGLRIAHAQQPNQLLPGSKAGMLASR